MTRPPAFLADAASVGGAVVEAGQAVQPGDPERWFTLADAQAHCAAADRYGDDVAGGLLMAFALHLAAVRARRGSQFVVGCGGIGTSLDQPAINSGQLRLPHLAVVVGQPLISALKEAGGLISVPIRSRARFDSHLGDRPGLCSGGTDFLTADVVVWEVMDRGDARQWLETSLPSATFTDLVEASLPRLLDLKPRLRAPLEPLPGRSAEAAAAALLAGNRYLSIRLIWQHEELFADLLTRLPGQLWAGHSETAQNATDHGYED